MNYRILILAAIATSWSGAAMAASSCLVGNANDLAALVARHYQNRTLPTLDKLSPGSGQIQLQINHSVSEAADEHSRHGSFRSLSQRLSRYIWRNERSIAPPDPASCTATGCRYSGSMLHSHLYLRSIAFVRAGRCLHITRISFEDGD